jgi:hypothetical protein
MPNWCFTSLTVTGPSEDISRFVKGLKDNQQENEGRMSILNTYYPTPKELDVTERFGDIPEDLEKQYAANTEKFGHRSWYDWNISNWGSKWADCETELHDDSEGLNEIVFTFDTAWSPISEGIKHVSSLFPTLGFVMSYDEEAGFYVGAEAYLAGETLHFQQEEPPCPDQKDDEDEDDYYQRMSDARSDLRSECEDAAECALAEAMEAVG